MSILVCHELSHSLWHLQQVCTWRIFLDPAVPQTVREMPKAGHKAKKKKKKGSGKFTDFTEDGFEQRKFKK